MVRFRIFLQNRDYRLLLPSLCALMLLSGWPGTSAAEPLRRIDQIKAALAAPKAQDMRAFAGQAPRRGLLHHPPSAHAFPPGPPLAMPSFSTAYVRDGISFPLTVIGLDPARGLTTTIPTVIFAYRLQLADGTVFDASSDVIDGVTPVQGVLGLADLQACALDRRRRLARDNAVERCGHACEFRGAHGGRISRPARHADRDPDHGRRTGRLRIFSR